METSTALIVTSQENKVSMDPGKIVSIRMTLDKIREEAESFRASHIFSTNLPVDIENVVEATLGMKIIPIESLQKLCDIEGFISNHT